MKRVLSLFAGVGGFDLGLERSGDFKTVAFCEIDPFCRRVLSDHWPKAKQYEDVTLLDGATLLKDGIHANCIVGGFPCQDASVANVEGQGTDGDRTGLFRHILRLARELLPDFILMENVTNLLNRGFGDVLGGLAEIGYDAEWECISAKDAGADHERDRVWILAYPQCQGWERPQPYRGVLGRAKAALSFSCHNLVGRWDPMVLNSCGIRDTNGFSVAMERRRLHALGNAVVPVIPEMIGRAILQAEKEAP